LPNRGAVVLYENARLIPGDGQPAIERAALLVRDGRISRVGRAGDVGLPDGAARVDLAGKTIIPTFINAHTHVGFQRGATYARENYGREAILDDLNRALYFGITAVVSQGIDPGDTAFRIRAEQAAGTLGGARLFVAGRGIGFPNAGPGAETYRGIAYSVTTPDEGRQAVREQAAQKVDLIKIWVDDRNGRAPRMTADVSHAIIDEAHKNGLKVNAHVFYLSDVSDLADAGIDGFAHLARDKELDDATIQTIVRRGVTVMTTLGTPERTTHTSLPPRLAAWLDGPVRDAAPAAMLERVKAGFGGRDEATAAGNRQRYEILQRTVAKLAKAGAKIALGSDTGIQDHPFGITDHRELELLVEAGMTPMQVLVAATNTSAAYLKLADEGALAAGKRANFIVLDANPLDDITNTRRIARVFVGGREIDRSALAGRLH
ncbi:MAG TPA: amidohydrolase family protein, partial [Vicinamibacterales bacterium]|nr:amidohydrolase family protein [Vicinamibacterales bacterium]